MFSYPFINSHSQVSNQGPSCYIKTFQNNFSHTIRESESLGICHVTSSSGPIPILFKLWPWGQKWPHSVGHMFYIGFIGNHKTYTQWVT